jgi:hypothetical protein
MWKYVYEELEAKRKTLKSSNIIFFKHADHYLFREFTSKNESVIM